MTTESASRHFSSSVPARAPSRGSFPLVVDTSRTMPQPLAYSSARSDSKPTDARMLYLESDLAAAYREAKAYGFDLPSQRAYERATRLLQRLIDSTAPTETLEIAFGEDGVIELTVHIGGKYFTLDVEPAGDVVHMVVRDLEAGTVVLPSARVTETGIVEQIERAAVS